MDAAELVEIESIKRLKYKYQRCVDLKLFDEMEECFTEDATSSYGDGAYSFEGREAIIDFLRRSLVPELQTLHTIHHPEIDLVDDTTAHGTWVLEDWVFHTTKSTKLHGAAHYDEVYVKTDDGWRIRSIGYRRIFEDHRPFDREM